MTTTTTTTTSNNIDNHNNNHNDNKFNKNNLVPELASELVLVEEGAIGADHARPLRSVTPVVAHAVHLDK